MAEKPKPGKSSNHARTKRDIVFQIASELGLTHKLARKVVQRTFDSIVEAIVMDERVEFRNFGIFTIRKRSARMGRNPQTGEEIPVPPRYTVTFKPGKVLEIRLREMEERDRRDATENARDDTTGPDSPAPS